MHKVKTKIPRVVCQNMLIIYFCMVEIKMYKVKKIFNKFPEISDLTTLVIAKNPTLHANFKTVCVLHRVSKKNIHSYYWL